MHVYCDESGNTGVDLLNKDQPVFALATTTISESDARRILAKLLVKGQPEAKYARLRSRPNGQQALLEVFSDPIFDRHNLKVHVIDKRFYLISHLIDKVIETITYEAGGDLYAGNGHVSLANLWFYTGHHILPGGHWDRVLDAFLQAIRNRSEDAYENFDTVVAEAYEAAPPDERFFVSPLRMAEGRLPDFLGVYSNLAVFDPAVDAFTALIQAWMSQEDGRFDITHDRSKPMKRNEEFLRVLMNPEVDVRKIGYGARQAELPLRISNLTFGESHLIPQLQIADIFAGAAVDCMVAWSGRKTPEKPATAFHEKMRNTRLPELLEGMWPTPEFGRFDEPSLGQVSIPDGTSQFLKEAGYFKTSQA
ncbi:MAG: DUF3800 domain-containing protein [Cupriavidus sp.]|nr:DUF3800 domain-containing protein [Cupriavidus sp.]